MSNILDQLFTTIQQRKAADPAESYVASLNAAGLNKILEKVGEESTELIIAAKDAQDSGENSELVKEMADLWFHCLVLLDQLDEDPNSVLSELEGRFGTSGIEEKQSR